MSSVQDTLCNLHTWEHFCNLEKQAKHPRLGVYRGRRLVITHYKAKGIARIFLVIKEIAYCVFKAIRLLRTDDHKVQELKDKVYQYCYQVAQQAYFKELDQSKQPLIEVNKPQQQANKNLLALEQANQAALSQKNELFQQIQVLQTQLNETKKLIDQKNAQEQEIQKLKEAQKQLEAEVQKLQDAKNQLDPVKTKMQQLQASINQAKAELQKIKSDAEQQDFKKQAADLKLQLSKTETELKKTKNKIHETKDQIEFAYRILDKMGIKGNSFKDKLHGLAAHYSLTKGR